MEEKLYIIQQFFDGAPFDKIAISSEILFDGLCFYNLQTKYPLFTIELSSYTEDKKTIDENFETLLNNIILNGFKVIYQKITNKTKPIDFYNGIYEYIFKIEICVGDMNANDAEFVHMIQEFDNNGVLVKEKSIEIPKYKQLTNGKR